MTARQPAHYYRGEHTADEHCLVNPTGLCCSVCGAYHGDPCPECGGCAYHRLDCPTRSHNVPTTPQPAVDSRHTPGPWVVERVPEENMVAVVTEGLRPRVIARIPHIYGQARVMASHDTREANAALIAAAPDLLDALDYALANLVEVALPNLEASGRVTSVPHAIERARAAIARATGQPGQAAT